MDAFPASIWSYYRGCRIRDHSDWALGLLAVDGATVNLFWTWDIRCGCNEVELPSRMEEMGIGWFKASDRG